MAHGHLDVLPINEKYFLCQVRPLAILSEKPAGLRAVPWRDGLTPVFRLKSGELRSDGSRQTFWGGDALLPVVDRGELSQGDGWVVCFNRSIVTTTPTPRLRIGPGRYDQRCGFVAEMVAIDRRDLAPWYSEATLFPSFTTCNVPSLLQLAEGGRVSVGRIVLSGTPEAWFVPTRGGLDEIEWLALGWHSVAAPAKTSKDVVRFGGKGEGLPLPATWNAMKEHGFGWARGVEMSNCELLRDRLIVPKCVVTDPEKASAWLGEPRLASLPPGAALSAERSCYDQFRVSLADFVHLEFRPVSTENVPEFQFNRQQGTVSFANSGIARLKATIKSLGYNGWTFVPNETPSDFIRSDELGRKFAIPETITRHKLFGLVNGCFRELPGTYVRKPDAQGLQRVSIARRTRKQQMEEAQRAIIEAVGEVPFGFDSRSDKVSDAIECVTWKRRAERGEAEEIGNAAGRLMAAVPLTKEQAEALITKHFTVVKAPIDGRRYLVGKIDVEKFSDEWAGDILLAIDRRWINFVHRAMLSETAQNSVALAFLGGA